MEGEAISIDQRVQGSSPCVPTTEACEIEEKNGEAQSWDKSILKPADKLIRLN
jgi:hypothetical protein